MQNFPTKPEYFKSCRENVNNDATHAEIEAEYARELQIRQKGISIFRGLRVICCLLLFVNSREIAVRWSLKEVFGLCIVNELCLWGVRKGAARPKAERQPPFKGVPVSLCDLLGVACCCWSSHIVC